MSAKRAPHIRRPPIGVGIIGFGFMGRTHAGVYHSMAPRCHIVGIADRVRPTLERAGNIRTEGTPLDLSGIVHHADATALLADARIDLVSVCTPTDTHVDIAIAALDAGKHVLIEKPVAATTPEVERLAERARNARTLCMPAMCLRFWAEWALLVDAIVERPFGKLLSLTIERLSPPPGWSEDFYRDDARTGGMITDLHIHDSDLLMHALGMPAAVSTTGNAHHLSTAYVFEGRHAMAHVTAEAAWDLPSTAEFRMAFRAVFERGMMEHDSRRGTGIELHADGAVGHPTPGNDLPPDGYAGEIRALVESIERGEPSPVSMDDAVRVARVLDAERASLERGGAIVRVAR
ncbi:MAG: Gfo/Idh/MocA family protein [Phycisphaerales bacterium]